MTTHRNLNPNPQRLIHPAQGGVHDVIEAWRSGRPIVFFLGSGVSAEAGFPTLQRLCGYLGRLLFAFHQGLYKDRFLGFMSGPRTTRDVPPSRLIQLFGWPSPEQLTSELWRWLKTNHGTESPFVKHWVAYVTDQKLLKKQDAMRAATHALANEQEWLVWIEQAVFLAELAERHDEKLAKLTAESLFLGDNQKTAATRPLERSRRVRGDWTELLDSLAEGNSDLTDALFALLGRNRQPCTAHVFLAFLTKVLGTQLILTTNFDHLVEDALLAEGLRPQVFDVFRDATVPHPLLVQDQLSVIKLHGSAYGLRIGERLQWTLDESTCHRILEYFPERALIVVLGFSGWERRTMQLMEAWMLYSAKTASEKRPSVLWLHQEPKCIPCDRLRVRLQKLKLKPPAHIGLKTQRILDAGTFLSSIYFRFASTYPVSTLGYRVALPVRVMPPENEPPLDQVRRVHLFANNWGDLSPALDLEESMLPAEYKRLAHKYFGISTSAKPHPLQFSTHTSLAMATFAALLQQQDYTPIWIDLEEHHTVEGVIADVMEKMRSYDPDLPELILPVTAADAEQNRTKACKRIWEGLTRRRYVMCFDQFESFGRPETVHHGTPRTSDASSAMFPLKRKQHIRDLGAFLKQLLGLREPSHVPADVYFAIALDIPRERHYLGIKETPGAEWIEILQACRHLAETCKSSKKVSTFTDVDLDKWVGEIANPVGQDESNRNSSRCLDRLQHAIRARGFLLKQTIRLSQMTPPHDYGRSKCSDEDCLATLAVMAIFRRPRSLVAVRAVLAQHLRRFPAHRSDSSPRISARSAFKWVDKHARRLCDERDFWLFEGETFWIHATVHETVYKRLTDVVREIHLKRQMQRTPNHSGNANNFVDLLMLAYWHRRIARYYYSIAFLASQDLSAFFEYVYHRLSALRSLTCAEALLYVYLETSDRSAQPTGSKRTDLAFIQALDALLVKSGIETPNALEKKESPGPLIRTVDELLQKREVNDAERRICGLLKRVEVVQPHHIRRMAAMFGANSGERIETASFTKIVAAILHVNRGIHVEALRRSFERTHDQLLAIASAETVRSWAEQILEHDLPALRGQRLGGDGSSELLESLSSPTYFRPANPVEVALTRFDRDLRNLRSQVTYLRRDYDACIKYIWDFADGNNNGKKYIVALATMFPDGDGRLPSTIHELIGNVREGVKKSLPLDLVKGLWQRLFERPTERNKQLRVLHDGIMKKRESVMSYARHIAQVGEALRRTTNCLAPLGEERAASLMLQLSNLLVDHAAKLIAKENLSEESRAGENVIASEHLSNIRQGIWLKMQGFPIWSRFDRLTADESVGIAQVPEILDEAERDAHTLEETARESPGTTAAKYLEFRTEGLAQRGRVHVLRGQFVDAHRLLDRAEAGLDAHVLRNRVLLSKVHLYRAEAAALSAHDSLCKTRRELVERIGHAEAHLDRASGELDAIERLLMAGRRDLSGWIFMKIGSAQIVIERLLLKLVRFGNDDLWPDTWTYETYCAKVERLVEQGLGALRCALDAIPYQHGVEFDEAQQQAQHYPERKALGLWLQMMVTTDAALFFGRMKAAHRESRGNKTAFTIGKDAVRTARIGSARSFQRRWADWTEAHRFEQFAALVLSSAKEEQFIALWKEWRGVVFQQDQGLMIRRYVLAAARSVIEFKDEKKSIAQSGEEVLWHARRPKSSVD